MLPTQTLPLAFKREFMALTQPQQLVTTELIENKLFRALYSQRQLEEVLVDFWLNHFNVFTGKGAVRMLLTSYERDAIRPYVLGRFRDMLLATARHPAMLFYLDNWQSQVRRPRIAAPAHGRGACRPPGLNENYGRELMELHTLGVDGGYTQADVINVARSFTGWTIVEPNRVGEFQFNPAMHDRGEKIVLGHTIPAGGGENDGLKVIDILATPPVDRAFHLAQAGAALRRRRSAAVARRPHGRDVHERPMAICARSWRRCCGRASSCPRARGGPS